MTVDKTNPGVQTPPSEVWSPWVRRVETVEVLPTAAISRFRVRWGAVVASGPRDHPLCTQARMCPSI